MTLKTSLLNFGVYRNTLKRFKWGSFLYFIILFFSVPFGLLMQKPSEMIIRYSPEYFQNGALILKGGWMVIPYLLALIVPTVTAILIFGNVHSVRQGIFTHSLPVTREANYVSCLLGGFSLMYAPILLNGAILFVMSFLGYGVIFSPWSVCIWLAVQMSLIFIMFSVACVSGFLTGNGVAHAAINLIIHLFPLLIALAIVLVCDIFLFGFVQSESFIAEEIMNNTPLVWLFTRLTRSSILDGMEMFSQWQFWIYIVGAATFYILAYFLYKKRKVEACGEVAAFKVFRPILKYLLSAAAAICTLGIMWSAELGAVASYIVGIVISLVVYFAIEMLISKTVKVFGKYKGYLIFAVSMAVVIVFCAYTSMFGYETRIPEENQIVRASVFSGYYGGGNDVPMVDNAEEIKATRDLHAEFIEDIPLTEREYQYDGNMYENSLRVRYELKNGRVIDRRYPVTREQHTRALNRMYENTEYKMQASRLNEINIENVTFAHLRLDTNGFNNSISLGADAKELLENVKMDVCELSYSEMEDYSRRGHFNFSIHISREDNKRLQIFDDEVFGEGNNAFDWKEFHITINHNFKRAMAFIVEKGYYEQFISAYANGKIQICTQPFERLDNVFSYKGESGDLEEFWVSLEDCVYLSEEDSKEIARIMFESEESEISQGRSYFVFNGEGKEYDGKLPASTYNMVFSTKELPDVLRKYVGE